MKISAIVAGTTMIKRPASRLSIKLAKEGVMTIDLGLGARGNGSDQSKQLITLYNIDKCLP